MKERPKSWNEWGDTLRYEWPPQRSSGLCAYGQLMRHRAGGGRGLGRGVAWRAACGAAGSGGVTRAGCWRCRRRSGLPENGVCGVPAAASWPNSPAQRSGLRRCWWSGTWRPAGPPARLAPGGLQRSLPAGQQTASARQAHHRDAPLSQLSGFRFRKTKMTILQFHLGFLLCLSLVNGKGGSAAALW